MQLDSQCCNKTIKCYFLVPPGSAVLRVQNAKYWTVLSISKWRYFNGKYEYINFRMIQQIKQKEKKY